MYFALPADGLLRREQAAQAGLVSISPAHPDIARSLVQTDE
jgi:hypothetical protein